MERIERESDAVHQLLRCWVKRKQISLWVVWNSFLHSTTHSDGHHLLGDGKNKLIQKSIQKLFLSTYCHSVQRSTAVQQVQHIETTCSSFCWRWRKDWRLAKKKMDGVQKEEDPCTTTHPHVLHIHHQSRAFPRLSKYRLFKWIHNEGRLSVDNGDDLNVKEYIVKVWMESTKCGTLLSSLHLQEKEKEWEISHTSSPFIMRPNCSSLFHFSRFTASDSTILTRFIWFVDLRMISGWSK